MVIKVTRKPWWSFPREGVGPQIGERQRRGGLRGRARSCRPNRAEWGLIRDQGGGRARKGPWGIAREGGPRRRSVETNMKARRILRVRPSEG